MVAAEVRPALRPSPKSGRGELLMEPWIEAKLR